jgi:hypothetical protein
MPVHSVFVVHNISGKILLSRYYDSSSSSYELQLSKELQRYHHKLRNSNKRHTLTLSPSSPPSSSSSSTSSTSSEIHVVFQCIQDYVLIVSGTDDVDETILSSILDSLVSLLMILLDQKLTESSLANADDYTKLLLCLDEMFPQGIIETLDVDRVQQLIKLKF